MIYYLVETVETQEDICSGIKKISSRTSPLLAFIVPRNKINVFRGFNNFSQRAGVYILFNKKQDKIYIGQTGNDFSSRLYDHDRNRDFWDTVFVFITESASLTLTHAKYIESLLIERAQSLGINMDNVQDSNMPDISRYDEMDCKNWEKQIVDITKMFNLTIFQTPTNESSENIENIETNNIPSFYNIDNVNYDFKSWPQTTIDLCNRIILVEGFDTFKQRVMSDESLCRKRFINSEDQKRSYGNYYKFDNEQLWLHRHGDGQEFKNDLNKIKNLFPNIAFDLLY